MANHPHLKIIYERDLLNSENQQQTLDNVFEYLGTYSIPVKTKLQKIAPQDFSEYIENYNEIVKKISQTKYAHFLEEV